MTTPLNPASAFAPPPQRDSVSTGDPNVSIQLQRSDPNVSLHLQPSSSHGVDLQLRRSPDDVLAHVEEIGRIPFVGTLAGSRGQSYDLPDQLRQEFAQGYQEMNSLYRSILEQYHPGADIRILGFDVKNLEVIYTVDGERKYMDLLLETSHEKEVFDKFRYLIIQNTELRSYHFPRHQHGFKGDMNSSVSALSQNSYRVDGDVRTRYNCTYGVRNFVKDLGPDIFKGLSDKQCVELRTLLHMRNIFHRGLGTKIEKKILKTQAEIDRIDTSRERNNNPTSEEDLRRDLTQTVSKLTTLRNQLNKANRHATMLGIAFRYRRRVMASRPNFNEAQFLEECRNTTEKSLLRFDGDLSDSYSAQVANKIVPDKYLWPEDLNERRSLHQGGTLDVGYLFRDDALQKEEKEYTQDVAAMAISGDIARRRYREYCAKHKIANRRESLEEALFVNAVDIAQYNSLRDERDQGDRPERQALSAIGAVLDSSLQGTVNVERGESLAEEFYDYTSELIQEMTQGFVAISEFDEPCSEEVAQKAKAGDALFSDEVIKPFFDEERGDAELIFDRGPALDLLNEARIGEVIPAGNDPQINPAYYYQMDS